MTYTVVLTREEDGRYTASVPALVGCPPFGRSVEEALAMAKEAAELYVETLVEDGLLVPGDVPLIEVDMTATAEAMARRIDVGVPEAVAVV
jgi:antitoxin HicB